MNSSTVEQMFVRHHVESSNLSSSSNGELTEWYCSSPLSCHRLFDVKVRILYSPQMSCWQTWLYVFDCKSKEESSNLSQDSEK